MVSTVILHYTADQAVDAAADVTVIKLSTRGWYISGPWYYKV